MNQQEVRSFLERYFDAHQTHYIERHPAYFVVELPIKVDKDLGNRPFYWTYVEQLDLPPQPMNMTCVFERQAAPPDIRGEDLTFGSPRLQQFFASAERHGRYVRLYEQTSSDVSSEQTALVPWLGINYKISFVCDRKKDLLFSLGFNLIHGHIVEDFYAKMEQTTLQPALPAYAYTMRPIYSLESARTCLRTYLSERISAEDTAWAARAQERLAAELEMAEQFYTRQAESAEEETDYTTSHTRRMEELRWQYEPRIDVTLINGGLFYLKKQ
ncbi:YqhG family protein [Aneurinibacillus uraniidurans]|uniref:YqhG family protein n=1 Tax=Aneurinibacillus uraniidurans TaxID=2966586 RepID=UPI00234AE2BD|nr:YqhG family protein [Aneurinibacillus sp. B1]WCN38882.1 YqhG family protein [Aneurinibacillus sp. B1]